MMSGERASKSPGFRCGVFPDHESMCRAVAERFVRTTGERELLTIALAGGTTPPAGAPPAKKPQPPPVLHAVELLARALPEAG